MKLKDMKMLVCDDSVLARKKLKDFLVSLGCENVYEATDGEVAVEMYEKYKPDVTFMDIVMPKKDGVEAVTDIMKIDANAKVIMASSVGTQTYLKDAIKAGACDFLQKPINEKQVEKALHKIMMGGN